MAEWTHAQIRTLIDERRTRNDEFHNLGRNRIIFWNSIADKINRENGTSFNGQQCKEKFSNLVRDYNAMRNFMSGKSKARSRTGARYFDEFRTYFWERPEDEFDRVRGINTSNGRRSRGSITPAPSAREVEHELGSSERRLSRSPSVGRRESLPVRERRSELPPLSLLTNEDYMDISIDTEPIERNVSSLTLPSYDTTIAQESSNAGGNLQ